MKIIMMMMMMMMMMIIMWIYNYIEKRHEKTGVLGILTRPNKIWHVYIVTDDMAHKK